MLHRAMRDKKRKKKVFNKIGSDNNFDMFGAPGGGYREIHGSY
jgi:hypothetical protein